MKKDVKVLAGEAVARQVDRNREWTQMDANLEGCGLAAPERSEAAMTFRSILRKKDVFGGTPNTADETSALPKELDSEHGQRWASIGGSALKAAVSR